MKKRAIFHCNRFPLFLWIAVHAGVFLALLAAFFSGRPLLFSTNLAALLPAGGSLKTVAAAEKRLTDTASRGVNILACSADFAAAREAAAAFHKRFAASGLFESLPVFIPADFSRRLGDFLHTYRYALLDAETRGLLETGQAETVAEEALAAAFGAFTLTGLSTIEEDPFLLAEREARRLLSLPGISSGEFAVQDGVLAARHEGIWYVLIRGTLAPFAAGKNSEIEKIYAACNQIAASGGDVRFVYSGVPFHSYESSSHSQRELTFISSVSFTLLALLLVYVFRSAVPVVFSLAAIAVSLAFAAAASLLVFGEIHSLSFVFGTTLIGVCADYSLHFFVHWKANAALKTGGEIRSYLTRGIVLSFASSEICFAAMLFAPFAILRQFAVFSFAGLASSFLTAMCLYPYLRVPQAEKRALGRFPRVSALCGKARLPRKIILAGIIFAALALLFIHRGSLRIENDLRGFYTMSETLKEAEALTEKLTGRAAPAWYFILTAETPEELLTREEAFLARLEKESAADSSSGFLAASLFVPSAAAQKRNYAAAKNLAPLAERQFALLGFPAEAAADFSPNEAAGILRPGDSLPEPIAGIVAGLWLGEAGGKYYSCVLPLGAAGAAPREEFFRNLARGSTGVFFVNRVRGIGAELDALTRTMLLLFGGAWLLISAALRLVYSGRDTLTVSLVPLVTALVTAAVLAFRGAAVGFFPAAGFVLVFGLGLDYIFYRIESGKTGSGGSLTSAAIALSFATTVLSFGALALSGFPPVHILGLTVFSGLCAAFASSMLLSGGK